MVGIQSKKPVLDSTGEDSEEEDELMVGVQLKNLVSDSTGEDLEEEDEPMVGIQPTRKKTVSFEEEEEDVESIKSVFKSEPHRSFRNAANKNKPIPQLFTPPKSYSVKRKLAFKKNLILLQACV